MKNLDLMSEAAALGGYVITGTDSTSVANKARALRRINIVKADVIGRYADWPALYREGWLALTPLYSTGTISVTQGSNTVTGSGTSWTSTMKGRKLIAPDGAHYKIASVSSTTSLVLTQPYQGSSLSGQAYSIWQDEYRLYPEVKAIGGFVDYAGQQVMRESQAKDMKSSFPNSSYNQLASIYQVVGREGLTSSYSTGTVTCAINTNVWTGSGTAWLANVEPGMAFTVGSHTYHIKRVNSDTELETYQLAVVAASGSSYSAVGKNCVVVRFNAPTVQEIVSYWYWAKDYPFLNDSDEDWFAEIYPKVLINGIMYYDYLDKNDHLRAAASVQVYEASIKDMHVSALNAYTGVRTLGVYIPNNAWE